MNEIPKQSLDTDQVVSAGGIDAEQIHPGCKWYLLAGMFLVIGVGLMVGGVVWSVLSEENTIESLERIIAPGTGEILITEPGEYLVYYEYRSNFGGRVLDNQETPPAMSSSLTFKSTGEKVPLRMTTAVLRGNGYSLVHCAGTSLWKFQADSAGVYELSVILKKGEYVDGNFVMAVGKDMGVGLITKVLFIFIPAGGLCVLGSLIIGVVTLMKRSSCKRRLMRSQAGGAPGRWSRVSP